MVYKVCPPRSLSTSPNTSPRTEHLATVSAKEIQELGCAHAQPCCTPYLSSCGKSYLPQTHRFQHIYLSEPDVSRCCPMASIKSIVVWKPPRRIITLFSSSFFNQTSPLLCNTWSGQIITVECCPRFSDTLQGQYTVSISSTGAGKIGMYPTSVTYYKWRHISIEL